MSDNQLDNERFGSEFHQLREWIDQHDFGTDASRDLVLRNCLLGAFDALQTINEPTKNNNNDYLANISCHARALHDAIESLTKPQVKKPLVYSSFNFQMAAWGTHMGQERQALLSQLAKIESSAKACMIENANGAPAKIGKRRIIEKAFEFFLEYGNKKPTEEGEGAFASFCREFYYRSTGIDLDDRKNEKERGISRQIKSVIAANRDRIDAKWGVAPNRRLEPRARK